MTHRLNPLSIKTTVLPGLGPAALCLAGLFALTTTLARPLSAHEKRNLHFRHVTVEQGLSQAAVNVVLQDREGFMWFGTQEGLNRYDGYQFTVFRHDPQVPDSLSHDFIWSIHQDSDGVMWLGTDGGGLNRFDPSRGSSDHFRHDPEDPTSLSSDRVRVVLQDRRGDLWVATDGDGVNRFDRSSGLFERFPFNVSGSESEGLKNGHVRALCEDRQGLLWIATDGGGLSRFDPQSRSFTHFEHDPEDSRSLASNQVRSLFEDRDGVLWIGTYDGGLNRFEPATATFTRFLHRPNDSSSLSANEVRAIYQDSRGALWIGTDRGLNEWLPAEEGFARYPHDPTNPLSLNHDRVTSIFEDRGGVLWVATYGGLNRWNLATGGFLHYYHRGETASGLTNGYVTSFAEDRDATVWIGTYGGGLNRFDPSNETFVSYRHDPDDVGSLSDDRVMALLVDSKGALWAGTIGGGLERFEREHDRFTHFRHDPQDANSLSWNGATTIFEDSQGVMWVGTYRGGLNRFVPSTGGFVHFRPSPTDPRSLSSDRVVVIFEDESRQMWIGTDGGGLNRFNPRSGRFEVYRHDPDDASSLSSDHIWAIQEGLEGDLWIGTQGGGLNRWALADREAGRAVFRRFTAGGGPLSGIINAIQVDGAGNLWLSTNRGLTKLDPRTEKSRNYDSVHGLQSNEFNFASAFKASDGQLFFGGINGFNAFYPERIEHNTHVAPIVMTDVQKFNRSIEFDQPLSTVEELELGYKDHVIAFDFALLDFTAPTKNRYKHKLEGFDKDWVDIGTRHRASYTNLSPGTYTLRVKGASSDGAWSEEALSLRIIAHAPPWRTWWAYFCYLAVGVVALTVYARGQMRKKERAVELARANDALKQEIVERQAKERALDAAKRRAQEYLDVVEVIMVAIDDRGCVTLINQKGCRILGYREEEILGKDWFTNFVPVTVPEYVRRNFLSDKQYEYFEYPILTKDGSERTIAWHSTSLPAEDGHRASILSSGIDVTQTRQLERHVSNAQKMDALGTLTRGIAHDFNNVLAAIVGYSAITLESLPQSGEVTENVRQIFKAGERAKALVQQILTFSRQGAHESRPISVQAVVEEALVFLRASLPATVEIRQELDRRCLPILADPSRIHQVVLNLCTNAYQAMTRNEGVLEIRLEQIEVGADAHNALPALAPGPHVKLTVKDNGLGIDSSILDRIYEPFFTTKEVGEGTGLGLSVVHGIVAEAQGEIAVESEVGAGTTFDVFFPCSRERQTEEPVEEATLSAGSEHVLLVDDEETLIDLGRKVLTRLGYDVFACNSPAAAVSAFKRWPGRFDIAITDRTMPEMTGVELAAELQRIAPDFPVLLMSGLSFPGDRSLGCIRGFVKKPFTPSEVATAIRRALDAQPGDGRDSGLGQKSPAPPSPPAVDRGESPAVAALGEELR